MTKSFVFIGLSLILTMTACTDTARDGPSTRYPEPIASLVVPAGHPTAISQERTLTVFAAASLTGAFREIGTGFESTYPGVSVNFNFAGSQILRAQIEQGAVADVFASADHNNMDVLFPDELIVVDSYRDFTTNRLTVILPPGNPGNVQDLGDLAKANLKLVLADSSVPAGNYARQIFTKMSMDPVYGVDFMTKVLANIVSNETDVKQVVTKVELGEADAGIVYVSDSITARDHLTISIPENFNIVASYPIAILTTALEPDLAVAFVDYVISPTGQAVLSKWGFSPMID